jgi:orotate phosphoribosyltransferase
MSIDALAHDRDRLLELLRALSYRAGTVRLASGKTSDFYVDCKQTTLSAEGHVLVGRLVLARVAAWERSADASVAAVGGLTLGADPIASAVSLTSALAGRPLPAFIVRKEAKGHGTGAWLEGADRLPAGAELVVLEDVCTTGGSALAAVRRVREAGFVVRRVIGLVDREEGARAALEAEGLSLDTLYRRGDFLTTPSGT